MTRERAQSCFYHRDLDWVGIAAKAVELVEQLGESPEPRRLDKAINSTELSDGEIGMLHSLFWDSIVVGSERRYTNGQHRGCALRLSGAKRTVVSGN